MISQKSAKVPPNGRLEKNSKLAKVSNNLSPSKRTITTYLISLLGLGTLVLAGFAVWSVNRSTCDGTFNLKANTAQGLELAYTKNNCYPAQSQQVNK